MMIVKEELVKIIAPENIQRMHDKCVNHISKVTKREGDKIKDDINRRIGLDYVMNDFNINLYWEKMRTPQFIIDSLARHF